MRGLRELLQKSLNNEQLMILEYNLERFFPPGENYNSVIAKLDVTISRAKGAKEETIYILAKTPPPSTSCKATMNWSAVLKKEVFVYVELIPMYRELEKEAGIEEDQLINIIPKYFGHRLSLNKDSDEADEDSMLLIRNLKVEGYYSGDRLSGLGVVHAKKALSSLARYHALGIALKQKRPDSFNRVVAQSGVPIFVEAVMDAALARRQKVFNELECFKEHLASINNIFENCMGGKSFREVPEDPWSTITHGDFWVTNIMFHKDKQGNIDDVKFVDFQLYSYNSPLIDVISFVAGSLHEQAMFLHLDELLDLYYDTFIQTLKRMGCDVTMFSRSKFNEELVKKARKGFALVTLASKFLVQEAQDDCKKPSNSADNVLKSEYTEKLLRLIRLYEERRWFDKNIYLS